MHLETCASCSRGWEKRCRRDRRLWGACSPDQHPLLAASGRHVQTHELGGRTSFELALAIMWLWLGTCASTGRDAIFPSSGRTVEQCRLSSSPSRERATRAVISRRWSQHRGRPRQTRHEPRPPIEDVSKWRRRGSELCWQPQKRYVRGTGMSIFGERSGNNPSMIGGSASVISG